jgi:acetone carboxylase gamma subunit
MPEYDIKTIRDLVDAKLPWFQVYQILSSPKDSGRFEKYLQVLQERVPWKDKILLPYGLHLYIVEKSNGSKVVKCDCGHEFGDYKKNWKLSALIYVRGTEEKIAELYPKLMGCDPKWMELREIYCPGCMTLLEVEAAPPGYPLEFSFQPNLEAFYKEWLGKPLKEERKK